MRLPLASHCTSADSDVTSRHHLESGMVDRKNGLTYADSGVDIDAGNRLVDLIKPMVRATARAGADAEIGGFGGLFDLTASEPRSRSPSIPGCMGGSASTSWRCRSTTSSCRAPNRCSFWTILLAASS